MSWHQFAMTLFAGWLAGTLCSIGAALNDSPHEGFKRKDYA